MISVGILTKDSQKHLKKVLECTKAFDEVIILDTGSKDQTLEIAAQYPNVKIFKSDFIGFGPLRNNLSSLAKNDWILALDSDEIMSDALITELLNLKLSNSNIYSIIFHNYYNDKHITYCGWHNERHVRLYNRKLTSFSDKLVHEKVIKKELKTIELKNPIFHYSYNSTDDFLRKMQNYSSLFAKENKEKKKASLLTAISHGLFAFFRSYFIKRGIFGGKEGFIISIYNANTAYYKYLKLAEEQERSITLPEGRGL